MAMCSLFLVFFLFAFSLVAADFTEYVGVKIQHDKSLLQFGVDKDVTLYRRKASVLGLDGTLQVDKVTASTIAAGDEDLGKTLKEVKTKLGMLDDLATKADVKALTTKVDQLDAKLTKIWQYLSSSGAYKTTTPVPKVIKHCGDVKDKKSGVYTIKPKNTPYKVYCNNDIDGGGWTICLSRTITGKGNQHIGRTQLTTSFGDPASNDFGINCAKLMDEIAPQVEFLLLERAGQKKWQWIYPLDTARAKDRWMGSHNVNGDAKPGLQCKGSDMSSPISNTLWQTGYHNNGGHRTGDSYFIWQVGRGQNSRLIMELGNGDQNHPFAFMTNCDDSSWWSGCKSRGSHSVAYKTDGHCTKLRKGPVGIAFRVRPPPPEVKSCMEAKKKGMKSGVYVINPKGSKRTVYCNMDIDGGGWTVCLSRTITGDGNQHIGKTQLTTTYGDPSSNDFAVNCAGLMQEHASKVEFLLFERAGEKKWQWIYPLETARAKDRWTGSQNANGDSGSGLQCKGSSMSSPKSEGSWRTGYHNTGGHRTGDSYFIWQVGRGQNSRLIMELGNGDQNHPFAFMTNCDDSDWWSGCKSRGSHSVAYKTDGHCKDLRKGPVGIAFRTR